MHGKTQAPVSPTLNRIVVYRIEVPEHWLYTFGRWERWLAAPSSPSKDSRG